jgi:hypothetical protein
MVRLLDLTQEAARAAIALGDFPASVIAGPRVAVVMTQNWCPDWFIMKSWLGRLERSGEPTTFDIDVYVFVYNRAPFFREFMEHKEQSFGNYLIPYVRCYRDGKLVAEGNRFSAGSFLKVFA